jgi:peptide/nickel transport system substrate-binding protein
MMKKGLFLLVVLMLVVTSVMVVSAQEMTDVGTPRNETLIFQTFDRQASNPDQQNPLMDYVIWRGFRELGWSYLWETDTSNGAAYPELATALPEVLNPEHTKFRFSVREGVYWSDGVEFTADDIKYTLDTYFGDQSSCLTFFGVSVIKNYVKSYNQVDKYTMEVETINPAYDFATSMGVATWGPRLNIVPKHVFEKQTNLCEFRNPNPVTLGPYTVKEYDPNGFWQLWQLREDWQRSGWAALDKDGYMPKYVLYKDYGPEETRSLSFVQNAYDVDTFMSPESIKAAQALNPAITTFSSKMPYHNMDDACSYGLMINLQRPPYDQVNVRWALTLALDLKSVGINSLSGEFLASAIPLADTQVKHPVYYEPLKPWLQDFALSDGYKPFDSNFTADLAAALKSTGAANIPDDPSAFGMGWWKYDVEEAGKLLQSAGFTKGADGNWNLPDGKPWTVDLVIPGDWNKVMQRVGFSIADSWRKAGIQVNLRQVDSAEFGVVQDTNAQRSVMLNWKNCIFSNDFLTEWRTLQIKYVQPFDSNTINNSANQYQWANKKVDELVTKAASMDTTTEEFHEIGREVIKEFITDMAYINLMGIPTTIPTNESYWTNFPKQDNYYAVPYTWWSSAKMIVANIKPVGQ